MPDVSTRGTNDILVTHPGRQHSHQLAVALEDAGRLAAYWTGVPARPLTSVPGLRTVVAPLEKHSLLPLPDDQVQHNLIAPLARRVFEAVLPQDVAVDWSHRSQDWFDRWCASRLHDVDTQAVVCYENAALHTFRAAKERGWATILDAASFHHAWQDRHFDYPESDAAHERITARKDREIELADYVLTVSELARESYIDGGVPPERVASIPVGCDLDRFQSTAERTRGAPFTFIFAGHASARKGVDTLLDAARRLEGQELDVRLWFAGGHEDDLPWQSVASIEQLGYLPQEVLADRLREADCLVLPSRHDSFGMVVVEAMATGCPVIVSDQVGAKQAVTDGESGWIVPAEDADALADRMRWCIENPDAVRSMREAARSDASDYSWDAYRRRVVEHLQTILAAA
jgi:glycosyltransferase involved in cell wall biosynthesis